MTDPVADFLTRIRNAIMARKTSVDAPYSKLKRRVADILKEEGYVLDVTDREDPTKQGILTVTLKWDETAGRNAVEGIKRISKPGQRVYVHASEVPSVRKGLGTAILSTSKGVVSDATARKHNVGGEVLCEVW